MELFLDGELYCKYENVPPSKVHRSHTILLTFSMKNCNKYLKTHHASRTIPKKSLKIFMFLHLVF